MNINDLIPHMYNIIDNKDSKGLVNLMTDDANFIFANIPAAKGKSEIISFLDNFFESIKSLKHEKLEYWQNDDKVTARGQVTYTRLNETELSVPFAVILKMQNGRIRDYQIYADTSELYK